MKVILPYSYTGSASLMAFCVNRLWSSNGICAHSDKPHDARIKHKSKSEPSIPLADCQEQGKTRNGKRPPTRKTLSSWAHSSETDEEAHAFQIKNTNCLYMNTMSSSNKIDELDELSNSSIAHLIGISGIWACHIKDLELATPRVPLFRNDRETGVGGGVALYLRSCLVAHQVYTQEITNLDTSVWFSVIVKHLEMSSKSHLQEAHRCQRLRQSCAVGIISLYSSRIHSYTITHHKQRTVIKEKRHYWAE